MRIRRLTAYLPALVWALFLLWLGGRPAGPGVTVPGLDKVAHFGLYGVLGVLAGAGWHRAAGVPPGLAVIAIACAVGAADELHQTRVPTRTADPFDFAADAAGVTLGFVAGHRSRRGREPDSA